MNFSHGLFALPQLLTTARREAQLDFLQLEDKIVQGCKGDILQDCRDDLHKKVGEFRLWKKVGQQSVECSQ